MEQRPVFTMEGITYVYIQYNNLILMSVTKRNSNVALMFVYLYKLVSIRVCWDPFVFPSIGASTIDRLLA